MNTPEKVSDAPAPRKKPFEIPNALAVTLSILLAFFTVAGLIGFNTWRVLFNPPLVKQALTAEVISSDLVPATLEVFSEWRAEQRVKNKESLSGVNEPDIVLLVSFLKAEGWREIKRLLITDEFIAHLVSASVDGLYAWVDSDDLWPSISWNMTPLKERMSGQEGIDTIMIAYSALPVATELEIADFQKRLSEVPPGVEVLYNLCQFPEPWHEDQVDDYLDALKGANENIPVTFSFSDEFGKSSAVQPTNLALVKGLLRVIRFIAIAGWVIALSLLALIAALKVRSLRSLAKYVGIPLAVAGILSVVIALIGQPVIIPAVTNGLLSTTSDFARQEIGNSFRHLSAFFFRPLLIQSAVIAGLGMLSVAAGFIERPKSSDAADHNEPLG